VHQHVVTAQLPRYTISSSLSLALCYTILISLRPKSLAARLHESPISHCCCVLALQSHCTPSGIHSLYTMAAVVAHQQASLWNRRPRHPFHVSGIHFTSMTPSYNAPPLQNYQRPTTLTGMDLPIFSANTMPTSVSHQSSALFAYDSSVNSYNMQESSMPQTYPMAYSSAKFPEVSYVASSATQPMHTVREVQHQSALYGNHMVNSESAPPVQPAPTYSDASYVTNCRPSSFEPAEATNPHFATKVDTLMKAIQAKQTTSPQQQEVAKVGPNETSLFWLSIRTDS
jgi:hypothetical protein